MWILLPLLAAFFWALTNLGDKYFVEGKVSNPFVFLFWTTFIGFVALPFYFFFDLKISGINLFWVFVTSVGYFFCAAFYFLAIKKEEISRVVILYNLVPIFVFGLSFLVLGEVLYKNQLWAFLILLIGGLVSSIHVKKKGAFWSRALPFMILSILFYAIYSVTLRFVSPQESSYVILWWHLIFMACLSLLLFLFSKFRSDFKKDFNKYKGQLVLAGLLIFCFDTVAVFFYISALSISPVALVQALLSSQAIMVFLMGVAISLFNKKVLREELDKKNILLKLTALILVVVGICILYLG